MEKWYQDDLKRFEIVTTFDLLRDYLRDGRIRVDKSVHPQLTTYHDPCNYGRKSLKTFGHGYFEEPRWIIGQCCDRFVEMYPNRESNYCCGGGGGAWALPFREDRVFYGRIKQRQIRNTGAELVVTSCHNCRDQILKSLRKEYNLNVEVKYIWELVSDALILEPKQGDEG
ncbi:MAG: (Fe-S)-binding protein [Syntrophobacteraceae bacterium]|nr:(Fe-S)-binding protein [Syntrophobacteraceae bacterium]